MADQDTITVRVTFGLTEHDRRRIRAGYINRAGIATRREIRQWFNAILRAGIDGLPEPRGRKMSKAREASKPVTRLDRAKAAPEDAVCRHCDRAKAEHGRMALTCPPRTGVRKGQTFEAVERFTPAPEGSTLPGGVR